MLQSEASELLVSHTCFRNCGVAHCVLCFRLVEPQPVIYSGGDLRPRAVPVDVVDLGGGSGQLGRLLCWQGQALLEPLLSSRRQQPPVAPEDVGPLLGFGP